MFFFLALQLKSDCILSAPCNHTVWKVSITSVSLNWLNTYYTASCNKTWEFTTVKIQDHYCLYICRILYIYMPIYILPILIYCIPNNVEQNLASLNIKKNGKWLICSVWEETGITSVWNLIVSFYQCENTRKLLLISANFNYLPETMPTFL